jgi:predicted ATPase
MKKIGFENFRRFQHFAPLEYGNITFLVGKNNSGKSTLVKALLLTQGFLNEKNVERFNFGNTVLEEANVVTYGRAKNNQTKDNFITFSSTLYDTTITIILSGNEDKTSAIVNEIILSNGLKQLRVSINPIVKTITFNKQKASEKKSNIVMPSFNMRIYEIEDILQSGELKKSSKEYIELNHEYEMLMKRREAFYKRGQSMDINYSYNITTEYLKNGSINEIIDYAVDEIRNMSETRLLQIVGLKKSEKKSEKFKNLFNDYKTFRENYDDIEGLIEQFEKSTKGNDIYYLAANPAKQSALFAIRDKNNALAQAINEYQQEGLKPTTEKFVKDWLKAFEIGVDFKVVMHAGEAYEVTITDEDGSKTHISDKGMGSIQAVLLIFRLAVIINRIKEDDEKPLVIIEEPELNLHPALQSKLTELFLEVHEKHKIDFIVETHSEYMIRRAQVFVAENHYATEIGDNPFSINYFPTEKGEIPYQMKFNESGFFENSFGKGFFDEASSKTLKLIKLKREGQK